MTDSPRRTTAHCASLTPFTDRIALTFELAGLRAAEITFALKVIDERWEVTPHKPIAGAGHARGGKWHTVWAKADDHGSNGSAKAANHRGVAVIVSPSRGSWRTAPWRAPFFLRFDYLVNDV